MKTVIAWSAGVALSAFLVQAALAQDAPPVLTETEAHSIATDAYIYLYPLVTMDITRKRATNVEPGKEFGRGPMNTVANAAAFPPADFKDVVRPNFDTLYSTIWLDMTKEPQVISMPDTNGRYYLLPMLDMWTDVFASPGSRTTGTQAGTYLVAPSGWSGDLPPGMTRLSAPTPYVWAIVRTRTDGPSDYPGVHKIQAGIKVTPLSQWGKPPVPVAVTIDPSIDMKTVPKVQVDTMPAAKFFAYAADLLKLHPPHDTDQPILAQLKRLGFEAGKSFDLAQVHPTARNAIENAPEAAQKLMEWKVPTLARVVNQWSMNTDTMGVYGNYYLKRAIVSQLGLGANLPEDAIYPLNLADENGAPLNGANKYTIHFEKDGTPPVDAFWSVTLYDPEGFQVPNGLNRFAVSSWMPFKSNPDGSLTLYVQNESPGKEFEANWLPAPKGSFNLTMRLYRPKSEALTGKWNPPPVSKTQVTTGFAQ